MNRPVKPQLARGPRPTKGNESRAAQRTSPITLPPINKEGWFNPMFKLIVALHLLVLRLRDQLDDRADRNERGSVTIETVAWAAAIIGIVTIAVMGITAYVRTQLGKL